MGVRGDLRMLETAVRRRWDVNTENAARAVNAHLGDPDPRVALRAAAIAALMESQNQKDEHKAIDEFSTRVIQAAHRLGIDTSAFGISQPPAIGTAGGDGNSDSTVEE